MITIKDFVEAEKKYSSVPGGEEVLLQKMIDHPIVNVIAQGFRDHLIHELKLGKKDANACAETFGMNMVLLEEAMEADFEKNRQINFIMPSEPQAEEAKKLKRERLREYETNMLFLSEEFATRQEKEMIAKLLKRVGRRKMKEAA